MRHLLPALIAAAPLLAQAPIPNTPAGQKLKAWLDNFNAGNAARTTKFAKENYSAKLLERYPPEKCGEMDSSMRANLGELHIHSVEVPAENAIKALLTHKEEAMWMEVSFTVEPQPPHTITGLRIGPGQKPAETKPAGSSGSQAAVAFPATPAGKRLEAWIENFNSGDAARIEKFAEENFSAEDLKETSAKTMAEMESDARKKVGELVLASVEIPAENAIKALLANKSQTHWLEVSFQVSPEAPHRMRKFDIGPAKRPGAATKELSAPVAQLTADIRSKIIESAIKELAESYVDAAAGKAIGEVLKTRLKVGAYDKLENPAQFAEAVTKDLRAINGDLHLGLLFSPVPTKREGPGSLLPGPEEARRRNFGVCKAEILEGNVGYLEIEMFLYGEGMREAYAEALRFLSRTDALIIDVRRNPGGAAQTTEFLYSHFLGATPVPTLKVQYRHSPEPVVRYSLADVPGPRRTEVPLYILTSKGTGSAAEEFCFVLKNKKRAILVGSPTGGAGQNASTRAMGFGFNLKYSISHVTDPESGLAWEVAGIQPDLPVPAERALGEAHTAALKNLLAKATDSARARTLQRLLASVDGRRQPLALDARGLERWAGIYEGREIAVINGRLAFARREGALKEELTALGGDRFALGVGAQ